MNQVINGHGVGSESGVAETCQSATYRRWHGVEVMAGGRFFSPSFPSAERSPPPIFSPRISLSLSNTVALPRPAITSAVIDALPIATTRAEGWLHGKVRGGSTVKLHKTANMEGRLRGWFAYLQLVALGQCFIDRGPYLPQRFGRTGLTD